jgi:glutathione peroxidase
MNWKWIMIVFVVAQSSRIFGEVKSVSAYDFSVANINGRDTSLGEYKGKVALFVNTASECGYTPQYAGLQQIYDKYKDRGFVVLAFPSNDFGAQEPGSNQEIAKFCDLRFKVKFPLFSKISVKGKDQAPLYTHLINHSAVDKGAQVAWNFEKFLVSGNGEVVGRFKSGVEPTSSVMTAAIEQELAKLKVKK